MTCTIRPDVSAHVYGPENFIENYVLKTRYILRILSHEREGEPETRKRRVSVLKVEDEVAPGRNSRCIGVIVSCLLQLPAELRRSLRTKNKETRKFD